MPTAGDFLAFEARLRSAKSASEAAFMLANEPFPLISYHQSLLWQFDLLRRPRLLAASGLVEIDNNTPFALWFSRCQEHFSGQLTAETPILPIAGDAFPEALQDGSEWISAHQLLIPLHTPTGELIGGLWLSRDSEFSEEELNIATWLAGTASFAFWSWYRPQLTLKERLRKEMPLRWQRLSTGKKRLLALACLAALATPVRLTALATAEVTPATPVPITAPAEGVVARILVSPNQDVAAGAPLIEMDDTATRNKLQVAEKTLEVAKADFARAASKAFSDDASKAELQLLEARTRERGAELAYLQELLERLQIGAPKAGVALFADAEEWRGRPVQLGERIMTIADPKQVNLTLFLAPDDAISLDNGAEVRMYLNVSPLSSFSAQVVQASYETSQSPEGTPAYVVKAALVDGNETPRLGLKGTAKVYGDYVPLTYYLLRKPLRSLRRSLGI